MTNHSIDTSLDGVAEVIERWKAKRLKLLADLYGDASADGVSAMRAIGERKPQSDPNDAESAAFTRDALTQSQGPLEHPEKRDRYRENPAQYKQQHALNRSASGSGSDAFKAVDVYLNRDWGYAQRGYLTIAEDLRARTKGAHYEAQLLEAFLDTWDELLLDGGPYHGRFYLDFEGQHKALDRALKKLESSDNRSEAGGSGAQAGAHPSLAARQPTPRRQGAGHGSASFNLPALPTLEDLMATVPRTQPLTGLFALGAEGLAERKKNRPAGLFGLGQDMAARQGWNSRTGRLANGRRSRT